MCEIVRFQLEVAGIIMWLSGGIGSHRSRRGDWIEKVRTADVPSRQWQALPANAGLRSSLAISFHNLRWEWFCLAQEQMQSSSFGAYHSGSITESSTDVILGGILLKSPKTDSRSSLSVIFCAGIIVIVYLAPLWNLTMGPHHRSSSDAAAHIPS
jgi:hypothetical protein